MTNDEGRKVLQLHPNRRAFLLGGGAAMVGAVLAACGGDDPTATATTTTPDSTRAATATGGAVTSLSPADFEDVATCQLVPEQTEGPFYLRADLIRRDITEGQPGRALRVGLRVVDEACEAISGAVVEIWHADVDGDYSAFIDGGTTDDAGPDTTFLRGGQVANDEGIVEFVTNYPGWYTGRAVHIHLKAHVSGTNVLTSQLYFPEDVTDEVHAESPYAEHGTRDTLNSTDAIAGDPEAAGNLIHISEDGGGLLSLLVLGVDRAAVSSG